MGINRLKDLDQKEVPKVPEGWWCPKVHDEYLELTTKFLWHTVAPELIYQRLEIYDENVKRHRVPPFWMVLKPEKDLRNWSTLVQEDVGIEEFAIDALKEVLGYETLGFYEANRILAHML